jgi:hypothetical protein
MTMGPH